MNLLPIRTARWSTSLLALLLVLLHGGCGGPVAPWTGQPTEPLDLEITLSAVQVHLLEPVTVLLDLYRRADLEVEFAPVVDSKDFQIETTVASEVPFGAGLWRRTTLVLRPQRGPAELVLPSFIARAKDGSAVASTPEQKITVVSLLTGQAAALEAPGEPFPTPSRAGWWVAGTGLLLVLASAAFVMLRRRTGQPRHQSAVAVPPHIKALRALARLRSLPRTTQAQVEAFYVEVSDVLRLYLEERFGLRAPERTTEEFLRELEGGEQLAREHRAELERFLSQCDLVKFAAVVPGENEHLAMHGLAEAFVESTRVDRSQPATPPAMVSA